MDMEQQTNENTKAIGELSTTVTRLATVVEITEKQRIEDRADVRNIFVELKAIGEKMGSFSGLVKDIATLAGDFRTLKHDLANIQQAQLAIPLLKDGQVKNEKDISDHETRVNALEKDKDTRDGASGAVRVIIHGIWAFASVGGVTFIMWLLGLFAKSGGQIGGF